MMKKTKKQQIQDIFQKAIDDKQAINNCIKTGGDYNKLANDRGIKFSTPV